MTRVPLILITGISGFVAKHCALELLRTKVQQNPPRKHGLFPA